MLPRLLIILALVCGGCTRKASTDPVPPESAADRPEETSLEGLMQSAERALSEGNLLGGIAKLEDALKQDPNDRKAITTLIRARQALAGDSSRRGDKAAAVNDYLKAAELARLLSQPPQLPSKDESEIINVALYNEACAFSLQKEREKALTSLAEAVVFGFDNVGLFETDPDLNSLRNDLKFPSIIASAIENERKWASEQSRVLLADSKPYPLDFTLKDVEGKSVHLAEIQGDVTIIHLWGTWCGPAVQQLPQLAAFALSPAGKKVTIIGLGYEDGTPAEAEATLRKFLFNRKLPYTCLIGDDTVLQAIPDFQGYPTTLFLDAQGQVRARLLGFQDRFVLEEMVKAIRAENRKKVE